MIKLTSDRFVNCGCLFILLVTLCFRLPLWFGRPLLISADQAVYLAMGRLLLEGKVPYLDFFDFNPPLIMYLSVIPNLIGDFLAVPVTLAFNLFVWSIMVGSVVLTLLIFYENKEHSQRACFFPLLAFIAVFSQLQFYDYGQREHFFVLFYFPYLITRLLRTSGGRISHKLAIASGISAAAGVCLKPQFMLTALAVELTLMLMRRTVKLSFTSEVKSLVAATCIYSGHFLFYPPAALNILFNQVLPIYSLGKGFFANTFIHGLSSSYVFSYPFYLLTIALILAFAFARHCRWFLPVVVFTLVSLISFINAGTIWTYRGLPMQAGAFMLLALVAGVWRPVPRARIAAILGLCLGVTAFTIGQWQVFGSDIRADKQIPLGMLGYRCTGPLQAFVADSPAFDIGPLASHMLSASKPNDAILYVGVGVRPAYPPVLITCRRPGSRYLHGMILPMLGEARRLDNKRFAEIEATVIANYGRDIKERKPALIYIEDLYIAPLFAKYNFVGRYMRDYELLGRMENPLCTVYRLKGPTVARPSALTQ